VRDPDESPAAQLSRQLIDWNELAYTIGEAAKGYRTHLEAEGFSPTMAETMAAQYHAFLLQRLFHGGTG